MNDHRKYAFIAVIPAVITAIVYLASLDNGFVNWDDNLYVYDNPGIRAIDRGFFKAFVASSFLNNWTPLTMFTYGLDYAVWGLDPFGYHLTNLIFHVANTFVVGYLSSVIVAIAVGTDARGKGDLPVFAGLFAAMLFGLHPAHVESVAWVSERKDVVSGLFFLISILFYIRYAAVDGSRKKLDYALSLISFILSIAGKPMAVTLPVVLLIIDFWPLRRFQGRLQGRLGIAKVVVLEKLPFFALSALAAIITVGAQRSGMASVDMLPMTLRFFSAGRAYIFYLYKLIFPVSLAPFYPLEVRFDVYSPEYLGGLGAFAAITIATAILIKKRPALFSAWAYFVVTLLPVVGILQAGAQSAADRYTYLPSIGLFILAGAGVGALVQRAGRRRSRQVFATIFIVVTVLLWAKTYTQIGIWKDPISLWTHEIEYLGEPGMTTQVEIGEGTYESVSPAVLAHYKRALWYAKQGEVDKALADYAKTLELNPGFSDGYLNRGVLYARRGELEKAVEDFSNAIRYNPKRALLYYNRAMAYRDLGHDSLAQDDFFMAESLDKVNRPVVD